MMRPWRETCMRPSPSGCAASGQRYTPQRGALVAALERARHPAVHGRDRAVRATCPQSSVYRNLAVLEHAGVVRRVITEGEFARYELAEDLTEHHHHLICSTCGRVEDVTVPPDLETTMDRALDRLREAERVRQGEPPPRPDRHLPDVRVSLYGVR